MVYSLKLFNRFIRSTKKPVTRLILTPNEVHSLPRGKQILIHAGVGWVTIGDQDIFLYEGQSMVVPISKHACLISPLHKQPLVIEER